MSSGIFERSRFRFEFRYLILINHNRRSRYGVNYEPTEHRVPRAAWAFRTVSNPSTLYGILRPLYVGDSFFDVNVFRETSITLNGVGEFINCQRFVRRGTINRQEPLFFDA